MAADVSAILEQEICGSQVQAVEHEFGCPRTQKVSESLFAKGVPTIVSSGAESTIASARSEAARTAATGHPPAAALLIVRARRRCGQTHGWRNSRFEVSGHADCPGHLLATANADDEIFVDRVLPGPG